MDIEVLDKTQENTFQEFLEKLPCCSAQTSLNWRNLICDLTNDIPYFIVAKQDNKIVAVMPLYYFKNKFGNILTSNAWNTISGILCSPDILDKKQVYSKLIEYSLSLAKDLDCSVLTVGSNPFMNDKNFYSPLNPDYVLDNFVQYIPICEIFSQDGTFKHPNYSTRTNLSRNLNKISKIPMIISDEQSQENINQAFLLQEKRMAELGAKAYPKKFFDSVLNFITINNNGKFVFVFYERKMISTCLFLNNANVLDIYLLCMDTAYKQFGPNFAITKYLLNLAYNKKVTLLNWMSSPIKGMGVYSWKEQWGSREKTFQYMTKVTGDISNWKKLSFRELCTSYQYHYLLPFNLLNAACPKITTKNELTMFIQSLSA